MKDNVIYTVARQRFPAVSLTDDLFDLIITFEFPYITLAVYCALERYFDQIKDYDAESLKKFISICSGLSIENIDFGLNVLKEIDYISIY